MERPSSGALIMEKFCVIKLQALLHVVNFLSHLRIYVCCPRTGMERERERREREEERGMRDRERGEKMRQEKRSERKE